MVSYFLDFFLVAACVIGITAVNGVVTNGIGEKWFGGETSLSYFRSLGEALGADGSAGSSAGEQPTGGSLVAEAGVAVAGSDEFADERGEGFGQHDGFAAESEHHPVFVGVDVVEGEPADRGGPLGVEQDEQSGDPVVGFRCRVRAAAGGPAPSVPRCRWAGSGRPIWWRRTRDWSASGVWPSARSVRLRGDA